MEAEFYCLGCVYKGAPFFPLLFSRIRFQVPHPPDVPGALAPVLSAAFYQRFSSRGEDEFATQLLSAMRYQFGGHLEEHAEISS
jgi:hypothetical protein